MTDIVPLLSIAPRMLQEQNEKLQQLGILSLVKHVLSI